MLKVINEKLSLEYFNELNRIINVNAQSERMEKYSKKLSFKEAQSIYDEFLKIISFKINS
jgi:hypothetical protein